MLRSLRPTVASICEEGVSSLSESWGQSSTRSPRLWRTSTREERIPTSQQTTRRRKQARPEELGVSFARQARELEGNSRLRR